jgi:hypothetical protein
MWCNLETLRSWLLMRQSIIYSTADRLCADSLLFSRAARSLITSVGTALIIPSIERIGVAGTDIIAAVLALVGQG